MMVALALLTMAAGMIGWKIHGAIAKKKFTTNLSRIQIQMESCYRLAINTRVDWWVTLERMDDRLMVTAQSSAGSTLLPFQPRAFPIDPLKMEFNGEPAEKFRIYFSPTGKISPDGVLSLSIKDLHQELKIPELFQRNERAEKQGPTHPDDVPDKAS
jgi:hypothetical protein